LDGNQELQELDEEIKLLRMTTTKEFYITEE